MVCQGEKGSDESEDDDDQDEKHSDVSECVVQTAVAWREELAVDYGHLIIQRRHLRPPTPQSC